MEIGGSLGRAEATGRGVMICAHEMVEREGLAASQCKVAVQGAGNVGMTAARLMQETGFTIVALSDISGGIYKETGLDTREIAEYLSVKGRLLRDYQADGVTILPMNRCCRANAIFWCRRPWKIRLPQAMRKRFGRT